MLDHTALKLKLSELKSATYYCLADEIGEQGTYHTHLFLMLRSPAKFSRIKKLFPETHIEKAFGSAVANREYIRKEGKWIDSDKAETSVPDTFEEWGEIPDEPGQGFRSDLAILYTMIADGYSNAEIMGKNPELIQHIGKMDKVRQDILEERYRSVFRELTVSYFFGPTETGKTRSIMEEHGYENVYRTTDYNHPFDRYSAEPVLCFDEFRSSLLIGNMLNYLDGYPLALPARYANRQACYERVYIVSNIDLKKQYPAVQREEPETWYAFLRRISEVIEFSSTGKQIHHGTAMEYMYPPPKEWVQESIDLQGGKNEA